MIKKSLATYQPVTIAFFWLEIALFLIFNRFHLCRSATDSTPDWKVRQSQHAPINYTNSQLKKFCHSTDINRINGYLDHIAIPRPVGSENHKKVSLFIRFNLEALGYRTEFFTFAASTVDGVKNFTNIVATKYPSANRRLVLACHYDSKIFSTFEFVGATDSAVPCALLLDAAHTLNGLMPDEPKGDVSLQLLFFDGEEAFIYWDENDSLYGSRYLANLWSTQKYQPSGTENKKKMTELDRIDAFVLLDLLGAANPQIGNYATVNDGKIYSMFPEIENQLTTIQGCLATNNNPIFHDSNSFFRVQDDHLPFYNRDVKVVHLIPWPFPNVWHNENDNRDALDTPAIENLSVIVRVFVARYLGL